jgi:hypothetical protein
MGAVLVELGPPRGVIAERRKGVFGQARTPDGAGDETAAGSTTGARGRGG